MTKQSISPDADDLYILLYRAGLKPRHFAQQLGVTESLVSKWLMGVNPLPDARAEQMVPILGRTKEEIIRAYEVGKARRKGAKISPSPPASSSGTARRRRNDPAEARAIAV